MRKKHHYTEKEPTLSQLNKIVNTGFSIRYISDKSNVSIGTIRNLLYRNNFKHIFKKTADRINNFYEELIKEGIIKETDKETQEKIIDNIKEFAEKGFDAFQDEKDFGSKIEYTFDDFDKDTHFNNQIRILNALKDILNLIKIIFFSYIGYIILTIIITLLIIKNI